MKKFNLIERGGKVYVRDHERKRVIRFKTFLEACNYIQKRAAEGAKEK